MQNAENHYGNLTPIRSIMLVPHDPAPEGSNAILAQSSHPILNPSFPCWLVHPSRHLAETCLSGFAGVGGDRTRRFLKQSERELLDKMGRLRPFQKHGLTVTRGTFSHS